MVAWLARSLLSSFSGRGARSTEWPDRGRHPLLKRLSRQSTRARCSSWYTDYQQWRCIMACSEDTTRRWPNEVLSSSQASYLVFSGSLLSRDAFISTWDGVGWCFSTSANPDLGTEIYMECRWALLFVISGCTAAVFPIATRTTIHSVVRSSLSLVMSSSCWSKYASNFFSENSQLLLKRTF